MSFTRKKTIMAMERDTLVAVNKRMVTGNAERVGRRELSHFGLPVIPSG